MSDGISPNNLNDLSKVYLDQISTFREMRKQETQKDIERWSQGADPTATQREGYEEKKRGEVLTALKRDKRPLDKKTKEKIAADIVKKKGDTSKSDDRYAYESVKGIPTQDRKDDAADRRKGIGKLKSKKAGENYAQWTMRRHPASVDEAKVDTGSAEAKASARNKRNTPAGKDYDFDTSVFITRKPGESLDSARTRKRREAHDAKRGVKESFSNWRDDLIEVLDKPETEAASQKEVTEKKVKNKIEINPKISEAIEEIGGQVLSIEEQDTYQSEIEDAVEYFYEQGINERGIELIIEEVGLDDFVEFVIDPSEDLMEERAARRASVRAKKFPEVKADVDKADAARKASKKGEYAPSYAKKETDVTDYGDKAPAKKKPAAMKKAVARKKAVLTQPIKKATPAKKVQTQKKVVKSVAKVKKVQPIKKTTKKGLAAKIGGAVKKGVERHQQAIGKVKKTYATARAKGKVPEKRAKEFGKGVKAGVKSAVKFAKDVKKVVGEELTVTAADKKGNTPAYQAYKAGKKNVKTGKPLYKAADHLKNEDLEMEGYQRNPEKGEEEARKADKRSAKQKRMDDPKKGINSPAFKEFMRSRGM